MFRMERPTLMRMGDLREEEHLHFPPSKEVGNDVLLRDSGYEDFEFEDDEPLDSDMEGSIIHRGRPKKVVKPPVPMRSEKRTSRILDNVMVELQNLDGATGKNSEKVELVQESDPYELYLSSEEDASLSDDYEDSLLDFEDEEVERGISRASSRKSQEVTARVVSFVMVGKPQIIDIYLPTTSTSISPTSTNPRHSLNFESLHSNSSSPAKSHRRPTPLKLYPSSIRRMSISSITSSHFSTHQQTYSASTTNLSLPTSSHISTTNSPLPPRKSSRLASLTKSITTSTHTFLSSDPFASSTPSSKAEEEPLTPKTPTSMASAAWKRGFNKTLQKGRDRKQSLQLLNTAFTSSGAEPVVKEKDEEEKEGKKGEEKEVVRYEDIIKSAGSIIKAPAIPSPRERRAMGLGRLGLARTKSGKGRSPLSP